MVDIFRYIRLFIFTFFINDLFNKINLLYNSLGLLNKFLQMFTLGQVLCRKCFYISMDGVQLNSVGINNPQNIQSHLPCPRAP